MVAKVFIESLKLYKLYSTGNGEPVCNVKQENDILHFDMGLYLRGITGGFVENALEEAKDQLGGKSRWK